MADEGIDQVRSQLDTVTAELKETMAANDTLIKENRLLLAQEAFRQADLNPSLAKLYVASDAEAEISVDAAKSFAETYGVAATPAPSEESTPAPTPAPAGNPSLAQMSGAGSRGGDGGQQAAGTKTLTAQEWQELARSDKVAAEKAVAEGRVKFSDLNGWRKDRPDLTGQNPFQARNQEATVQS